MPSRRSPSGKRPRGDLFQAAVDAGASDVHLVTGHPLFYRIDGVLVAQGESPFAANECDAVIRGVLGTEAYARFEKDREIDVSHQLPGGVRLRVNCSIERGNPTLTARLIPQDIPAVDELGLQDVAALVDGIQEGLVLFTGPTGAGKSTSLAALINGINQTRPVSMVTLEDPIEFLFPKGQGVLRQRQFGEDFHSFGEALRRVLRQDPEVVMVGEMRDTETIAAALTLAETGHLIFATLHTPDTAQAIDRIVDVFPPHQQQQVRSQLSLSLRLVVAQHLVPRVGGGRVAVREVLVNTPAVANIIRDDRLPEIQSVLQTGGNSGMYSFGLHARTLLKAGYLEREVAKGFE